MRNVVRKWTNDKWNGGVVRQINIQAFAPGPTHEWRGARAIFEGMSIRKEINSYLCK